MRMERFKLKFIIKMTNMKEKKLVIMKMEINNMKLNIKMTNMKEKEKIIMKMELVRRFLKYDFDKGVAGHNWC